MHATPHLNSHQLPPTNYFDWLSPREREIARLIAEGQSVKQIATRLGLSEMTVRCQRASIRGKLHTKNDVEVARVLIREGVVTA